MDPESFLLTRQKLQNKLQESRERNFTAHRSLISKVMRVAIPLLFPFFSLFIKKKKSMFGAILSIVGIRILMPLVASRVSGFFSKSKITT